VAVFVNSFFKERVKSALRSGRRDREKIAQAAGRFGLRYGHDPEPVPEIGACRTIRGFV
jgi:hypothetical protein